MKIIVLTHPEFLPDEAEALTCLLDKGLDRLHLRKPGCSEAQLEALIRQLPTEYYKRISLHRNPQPPQDFKGIISCSCHTLEEVSYYGPQTDYHFLSPIFDSISKQGYRSGFNEAQLRRASAEGILTNKTIALGGVSASKLPLLHALRFGGAAFLGDIWHDYHSAANLSTLLHHFKELLNTCKELDKSNRITIKTKT